MVLVLASKPESWQAFDMKSIKLFAILCAVSLHCTLPSVAIAQSSPDESTAAEPLTDYRVEIIVFEYLGGAATERWSRIDDSAGADNVDDASPPAVQPEIAPLRFSPESEATHTLTDIYDKMRRSRDYRPLVHTAWVQPGYPAGEAPPLALDRVTRLPRNLSGAMTLHRSRYLHLKVNLELAASGTSRIDSETAVLNERPIFHLLETRRMRSGELHFFDHPKFGVLARIKPVKTEEPAS